MDLDLVLAAAPLADLAQAVEIDEEGFFFEVLGERIRLLFFKQENGVKLLLTVLLVLVLMVVRWLARGASRLVRRGIGGESSRFWTRQGINLGFALLLLLGFLSIWFDDPTRLATGIGLLTAGLAFALQKVITAVAGYFVILRGDTFSVGDRISMGGVRGDVIQLGFVKTTIMEMGQPPSVQTAEPAMWVKSRQYTGRVVTVTNDKVFDEAIYNYTRDFPYLWEEFTLPIAYRDDRHRVEQILLVPEVPVERHRPDAQLGSDPAHRDPIDALARQKGERCFGYSLAGQLGCRPGWHFRTVYGTLYG